MVKLQSSKSPEESSVESAAEASAAPSVELSEESSPEPTAESSSADNALSSPATFIISWSLSDSSTEITSSSLDLILLSSSEVESKIVSDNSLVDTTDIDKKTIKMTAKIFKRDLLLIGLPPFKLKLLRLKTWINVKEYNNLKHL